MAANKLDLVWFGGSDVRAGSHQDQQHRLCHRLREEDLKFTSVFITIPQANIKSLQELKGKIFTFGGAGSISGHTMPPYFLLKAGIVPEQDFSKFSYSGAHNATALWVQSGRVHAGALNSSVWEKLVATKKQGLRGLLEPLQP
jgi:phosphonate transport system substrate-binding protein